MLYKVNIFNQQKAVLLLTDKSWKQCYVTLKHYRQKNKQKSHHLLCCQMPRCQDLCPRCPMFQADGQSDFGTSLTQLVSATPCQQIELMYVCNKGQWQKRSVSITCKTDTDYAFRQHVSTCHLTRWLGFVVSLWGRHSIWHKVSWQKQGNNALL